MRGSKALQTVFNPQSGKRHLPRSVEANPPISWPSRTDTLYTPGNRGALPVPVEAAANTSQCGVAAHEIDHT
jgi:hypothetical protein